MKSMLLSLLAVSLFLASCATSSTTATPSAKPTPAIPPWTTHATSIEGSQVVFVLTGPESASVSTLAYSSMKDYLNLPVSAETSPAASEAIETFLKKMSATLPSERFLRNGRGAWKVEVDKVLWDSARAELKALWEKSADPSVELERSADSLLAQGRIFDAATSYVSAAASTSQASSERFVSVMTKAKSLLASMVLTPLSAPSKVMVGQAFAQSFDVKVTAQQGNQIVPVAGALLRFSYKAKINGRIAVTGRSVLTDSQGLAKLDMPAPNFPVQDNVVVLVDVNPWLETLATTPKELRDAVAGLESATLERKTLIPYVVESAAKTIPLYVALADLDDKGSVQRRQETTTALLSGLQKAGFLASGIQVNLTLLKSPSDNVILTAWKFQGRTTGRALFGTPSMVSISGSAGQFTAQVTGTLKVVNLATNELVYQWTGTKDVVAGDRASATALAYRGWAELAVAALVSEL